MEGFMRMRVLPLLWIVWAIVNVMTATMIVMTNNAPALPIGGRAYGEVQVVETWTRNGQTYNWTSVVLQP